MIVLHATRRTMNWDAQTIWISNVKIVMMNVIMRAIIIAIMCERNSI